MERVHIYQFADFDIDMFIEKYLYAISDHQTSSWKPAISPSDRLKLGEITEDQLEEETKKYNTWEITHHPAKRGARTPDIISCKVKYLQDLIIRRAISNAGGAFSLHSQVLKNVLGDEYKTMLLTLIDLGYLRLGDGKNGQEVEEQLYYQNGKYSTVYSIPDDRDVECIWITNAKIKTYIKKEKDQLYKRHTTEVRANVDKRYGQDFREMYEKSLRKITLEQPEELDAYIPAAIQKHIEKEAQKKRKKKKKKSMIGHYYNYVKNQLLVKDKYIHRIDNAGRIYHILTNTDRNIKQFLNIAISADCKNSHPVLFNYFLFRWRGVSLDDAYRISALMHSIPEGSNIRRVLQANIPCNTLNMLTDDELSYIHQTVNGLLWDNITSKHPEINRQEIKENMFAEVFYSNDMKTYRWQTYAQEFRESFPNVMSLIKYWKHPKNAADVEIYMKEHGIKAEKPTAALSIAMMNLEAQIFTQILKQIYKKRWYAIHIHDCIVIPKTRSKNQPTKEQIISIMQDVYKEFGLSATFD